MGLDVEAAAGVSLSLLPVFELRLVRDGKTTCSLKRRRNKKGNEIRQNIRFMLTRYIAMLRIMVKYISAPIAVYAMALHT